MHTTIYNIIQVLIAAFRHFPALGHHSVSSRLTKEYQLCIVFMSLFACVEFWRVSSLTRREGQALFLLLSFKSSKSLPEFAFQRSKA